MNKEFKNGGWATAEFLKSLILGFFESHVLLESGLNNLILKHLESCQLKSC